MEAKATVEAVSATAIPPEQKLGYVTIKFQTGKATGQEAILHIPAKEARTLHSAIGACLRAIDGQ